MSREPHRSVSRASHATLTKFGYPETVVADFATPINPFTHHVIQFAFREDDRTERCVMLIPVEETDPDFARWLAALNVPTPAA